MVGGAALGKTGGGPAGLRRAKAEERSGSVSRLMLVSSSTLGLPRPRRLAAEASELELGAGFLGAPRWTLPVLLASRAVSDVARRGAREAGGRRVRREEEAAMMGVAPLPR